MVKVRFAPSPTGFLHIGGARTALFNWVYAKATGGKFVLRIEDTDTLRSKQEYVDEILHSLAWLGFGWDEIYYQSQRFDLYRHHADLLLKQGKAYTEETEGKGTAIIFKVLPQKIAINDLIRGAIEFDASVLKDQVLIKSDGTPTYNFACVVDDALMGITHIIRGDDHISNTPKQVLLYQALGFALPEVAHLPLIMGAEGRLSKRTGATAISDYRAMGYLAEALVNYLLLLSWAPGENREIISLTEASRLFDLRAVNKTAAAFDLKKLDWVNNQYIKAADTKVLADLLVPLLVQQGILKEGGFDRSYLESVVKIFQPRMNKVHDFLDWAGYFLQDEIIIDPEARAKFLDHDLSREFSLFIQRLEGLGQYDVVSIEEAFRDLVRELQIEAKQLIHPIRVALTGKTVGLGLFEVIYYLGKERCIYRLRKFIKSR